MGIKVEAVCTERFEMDFFRFGEGEKTLVMIPGLSVQSVMGSAKAIANEYAVMSDDFTVYVFDRRKELPQKYSVEDMADDTAGAIAALGLREVCVFGASQGGMIALELAARYPDLVKKAAVASTPLRVTERDFSAIEKWIEAAKQGDGAGLYLAFGEAVYPADVFEKYKSALTLMGKGVRDEEFRRFATLAQAAKDFDFTPRVKDIRCPLLAAASRDDGVFGDGIADSFKEAFKDRPAFEFHEYDGYGHAVYDTAPDFRDRLYDFFIQ